jgi:hypothetical protein
VVRQHPELDGERLRIAARQAPDRRAQLVVVEPDLAVAGAGEPALELEVARHARGLFGADESRERRVVGEHTRENVGGDARLGLGREARHPSRQLSVGTSWMNQRRLPVWDAVGACAVICPSSGYSTTSGEGRVEAMR